MGAIFSRLLPLFISYIESHPEVIEAIFNQIMQHVEAQLKANASQPKASVTA